CARSYYYGSPFAYW
nr:immunoglobulin heavy chain junction region [Mus musculus]MBK4198249.1 immunoglobulin heavy chain junction region [Mus musculus]